MKNPLKCKSSKEPSSIASNDHHHYPELFQQIQTKQWDEVKTLLDAAGWHATTKQLDANGNLLLHRAIRYGAPTQLILDIISANQSAIYKSNDKQSLPLHMATYWGASLEIIELLIRTYPQGLDCKNDVHGMTPRDYVAMRRGKLDDATVELVERPTEDWLQLLEREEQIKIKARVAQLEGIVASCAVKMVETQKSENCLKIRLEHSQEAEREYELQLVESKHVEQRLVSEIGRLRPTFDATVGLVLRTRTDDDDGRTSRSDDMSPEVKFIEEMLVNWLEGFEQVSKNVFSNNAIPEFEVLTEMISKSVEEMKQGFHQLFGMEDDFLDKMRDDMCHVVWDEDSESK